MVSTRWQKQNRSKLSTALLILFVSIFAIGYPASLFNLDGIMAVVVSFVGALGGIALAFFLIKRNASSLVRVLRFDYEEIERDFRLLFKKNHIQYQRQEEDDGYRYDFPGHELSMTIRPYSLHNFNFNRQNNKQPATLVTLGKLNDKNEPFAGKLASLIDHMAKQQPDNWEY